MGATLHRYATATDAYSMLCETEMAEISSLFPAREAAYSN